MREHITHVAFDIQQASITAAWLLPGASTPELRTIPTRAEALPPVLAPDLGPQRGLCLLRDRPLGYVPQRQLEAWKQPCQVIVPNLIPLPPVRHNPPAQTEVEDLSFVGLVPREHSSGGKKVRRGITKAGNAHLELQPRPPRKGNPITPTLPVAFRGPQAASYRWQATCRPSPSSRRGGRSTVQRWKAEGHRG